MNPPGPAPSGLAPRTPPKVRRPVPSPRVDSPVIARLAADLAGARDEGGRRQVLDAFWSGRRSPVVEPSGDAWDVTFLWRDAAAEEVLLFVNRLTDERDLDRSLMERLPGTDVWHLAYRLRGDWRGSYAVLPKPPGRPAAWRDLPEQATLRAALDRGLPDPLNPDTMRNRAGFPLSVAELPHAPAQPWLAPRGPLRGELAEHLLDDRPLWAYRPAEFRPGGPVVVALDGEMWLDSQSLPAMVDNLIEDGLPEAPVVLLVPGGDRLRRWSELHGAGSMPVWIADRLLPWADRRWGVTADPARRVVAGQSLGGAVALLTVAHRPDAVGRFLAQSASLWQDGVIDRIGSGIPATAGGHLEVGLHEWVLLEPNRELHRRLEARGVPHRYAEYNGGHDYACWRGGIADGLRSVLGGE